MPVALDLDLEDWVKIIAIPSKRGEQKPLNLTFLSIKKDIWLVRLY